MDQTTQPIVFLPYRADDILDHLAIGKLEIGAGAVDQQFLGEIAGELIPLILRSAQRNAAAEAAFHDGTARRVDGLDAAYGAPRDADARRAGCHRACAFGWGGAEFSKNCAEDRDSSKGKFG